jgi:probable F420-dependent oxidoreductase
VPGVDPVKRRSSSLQVGIVFPQTEIGADPKGVRDFAQAVEELGYPNLIVYDHVLGADTTNRSGWDGFYVLEDMFHEIFVLFGYLASVTERIRLVSGILILPQRQTALVAKQAAEVDVLSGGRLTLGVGIGWNDVEFDALGEDFHNRGRRSEEQIELLRTLWTQKVVDFKGRWHRIPEAGLNPLPVQRPIPIWFGGGAEPVIKRVGRMADGWLVEFGLDEEGRAAIERMRSYAREAGRDPASIEIGPLVELSSIGIDSINDHLKEWRELGASHAAIDTMKLGLSSPKEHIDLARKLREVLNSFF